MVYFYAFTNIMKNKAESIRKIFHYFDKNSLNIRHFPQGYTLDLYKFLLKSCNFAPDGGSDGVF